MAGSPFMPPAAQRAINEHFAHVAARDHVPGIASPLWPAARSSTRMVSACYGPDGLSVPGPTPFRAFAR